MDADRIGHEVLFLDSVKTQILQIWGEEVFKDGEVNRKALAKIVFDPTNQGQLTKLEAITHPLIRQQIEREISKASNADVQAIVLDVPLLFEAEWHQVCDKIVFVDTKDEVRQQRVLSRGWTIENWRLRESNQLSIVEKQDRSTDLVDGSGSMEEMNKQLISLWSSWGLKIKSIP